MPGVVVETGGKKAPRTSSPGLAIFVLSPAAWGPFTPTKVTSIVDFEKKFGFPIANSWGYQGVKQFFDEKGKADVYFGRIAHYTDIADNLTLTAAKATYTINDRAATPLPTLKVDGKYHGTEGNNIKIVISDATIDSTNKFKLQIKYRDKIIGTFDELTIATVESAINDLNDYITVTDLGSSTAAPDNRPANGEYALTGGDDGITSLADSDWTGNQAAGTGLYMFDNIKNKRFIMIAPGNTSRAVIKAMCEYSNSRQVGYVIYQAPAGVTDAVAVDFKNGAGSYSSNGNGALTFAESSCYHPWGTGKILSSDVNGNIPLEGAIAANFSKTDARRGVAKPAAGLEDGYISTVTATGLASAVDDEYLNNNDICPLVVFENYGIAIWGARTTSTDDDYDQIQITRTIQWFTQWCYDNFLKYTFEPLNAATYERITTDALKTLNEKYAEGWFEDGGTGDPNEAFFFQCDYGNNTQEDRDARNIIVDFGVRPVGATEIIKVRLSLYRGLSA